MASLKSRQNADGGWSQIKTMPSDAYATGQVLYALSVAGTASDDPALVKGREFLTKTQQPDGSWVMQSRPIKDGGAGAKFLPPITYAGSAWGTLGLIRSTP